VVPALPTSVAWAAPTWAAAVGMEATSLLETGAVADGAAVGTLPGTVAMLGMETTGMGTGTTTTTTTSPITTTFTITSTTASLQSELESVGGGPAMDMAMVGAVGFIRRLCIPEARIGGTGTMPALATTKRNADQTRTQNVAAALLLSL
jgi:hypothetical protein